MKTKFLKQLASYFTILVYSSTVLFSGASQAGGFYRPQMKSAVDMYNRAVVVAQKSGDAGTFADIFGFNAEDTKFVKEHLGITSPKISLDKSTIMIPVEKGDPIKLQIVDLDKGEFKINGLAFTFDPTQSLDKNAERIVPLAQAKGFGLNSVWELVMPSAHAFEFDSKALGFIIAGVVAVALTIGIIWYLNKSNSRKAEVDKMNSTNAQAQAMKKLDIQEAASASANRVNEHEAGIGSEGSEGGEGGDDVIHD